MMNKNTAFKSLTNLVFLCWSNTGLCVEYQYDHDDSIQIHGFAAQSFLKSTTNDFFGHSEDGSWDFRELGINGLWRPLPRLQLSLQFVARKAGKTDDGKLRVDYIFADCKLFNSNTVDSGLRLGRVTNPYGFYNETRDIVATRPSILLPQSVYFDANRNFALSSDGVQFYHEYSGKSGDYLFQFGVFEPRTEDPDFEPAIFLQNEPGKLEGTTSWMGRLLYEYDFGRVRLGLTTAGINVDYDPAPDDPIRPGAFHFHPYIASVQYNRESWSLTAEYARRSTRLDRFGAPRDIDFTGNSYFIQGIYRLTPRWEVLLRYDSLTWNDDDPEGRDFKAQTGLPNHYRFARDWTFGVRWDLAQNVMLRAEWHRVSGTGWLSLLENPPTTETRQRWNLLAFSAAIKF